MARQKDTFYFDGFRRSADYACQAAKLLSEVMHDFNPGQLRERMDSMHAIEKSADEVRHDMMDELVTAFITPFDREDIDELGLNVSSCTASTSPMLPGMPGEFLCNPDDYKKAGALREVDGTVDMEDVFQAIVKVLGE